MATSRTRKPRIPAPILDQAKFTVEIDIDKLTWEDMRIIMSADGRKDLTSEMVMDIHGLFERIVVGGARAVPVVHTMEVIESISKAMETLGNPKNSTSA
jgi:hypothetical protein